MSRRWKDEPIRGGSEGLYLRRIDSCITQLQAHGPSRTCKEGNDEEKKIRDEG